MTDTERSQWLVHAAYLRQRAQDCASAGKHGKAREANLAAQEAERRAAEVEQRVERVGVAAGVGLPA